MLSCQDKRELELKYINLNKKYPMTQHLLFTEIFVKKELMDQQTYLNAFLKFHIIYS